ncbi:MAG: hypothetical protein WC752_00215 [Patescibacteria group bacterium]|jgi:hypothetical protein
MKKHLLLSMFFMGAMCLCLLPQTTNAAMDTTCTVTSSDATDMVVSFDPPSNSPNPLVVEDVVGYVYTADTAVPTYTVSCTVTSDTELLGAPMLMTAGFEIDHDTFTVTQNSTTSYTYSYTGTTGTFYVPDGDAEADKDFVMVFIAVGADPSMQNPTSSGPPASMSGGYISTTVQEFQITPPSGPDEFGFGLTLDGPSGVSGFFKMYMPQTMLNLMGTMSSTTITAEDLAVFIDDAQATTSVTTTAAGGAYIDIGITFSTGNTTTASALSTGTVTKSVETKEKEDLSAAFKKKTVLRGNYAKMYGWKKTSFKNKAVKIYRKLKGDDSYTLVDTVYTDNTGYYLYKFKPKAKNMAKGTYYFKAKCAGINSTKQTLKVN